MKQGSGRGNARIAALLAGTIIASGSATQALAQTPPPVRQEIDRNGVDLINLTFNTSENDISVGTGDAGLSFERAWRGSNWRHNFMATITNNGGSTYVVSFGGRSDSFTYTTWPNFVATEGNGATLVLSGTDYIYTAADGTVAVFGPMNLDSYRWLYTGLARHITFPGGDRWTFQNKVGQYCDYGYWTGSSCSKALTNGERVVSVTNRFGHQVKIEYAIGTMTDHVSFDEWRRVTKATAINMAVEYCDPAADSCSLTNSWPSATYAKSGTSETVADTTGTLRSYTYDAPGTKITAIRRATAGADTTTIGYSSGRVSSVTTEGVTYNYATAIASNIRSVTVTGPQSYWYQVQSHTGYNFVTREIEAGHRDVSYIRDTSGRITLSGINYEGQQEQYVYDARGNITETRKVAKTGSGLADIVTTAGYDASCTNTLVCNRPLWTRDAKGNQTDYTYDPNHGGLLTVTLPAATTGGVRPQTRYTYQQYQAYSKNSAGSIVASGAPVYRLTGVSSCQTAASCAGALDETKVAIAYGPQTAGTANNLLAVSATSSAGDGSLSATAAYSYDNVGNSVTVDGPLAGTDDIVRTRYDARRRVVGTVGPDPDGAGARKHLAQRASYNLDNRPTNIEVGNVNSQSDADWAAMSVAQNVATSYDANARPVKVEIQSGGVTQAVTQTSYDSRGRVDCAVQRMNPAIFASLPASACTLGAAGTSGPDRITKTSYNSIDQVTKVQTAFGTAQQSDEVTAAYNYGVLDYVVDAENNRTEYGYDGHNRRSKTEYPSTTKGANAANAADYEELAFDANGNVTNRRLRDGTSIAYTIDNLDRVTLSDLTGTVDDTSYSYDLLGRAVSATRNSETLTFAHDALGRLTSETQHLGTTTHTYDAAGRRLSLAYPGGVLTVNYDYDVAGNVTKIRENGATSGVGVLADYAYDNLGRRSSITFGNGSVQSFAYGADQRLATLTNNLGGAATTHDLVQSFAYNPAGQIASVTRGNDAYAWPGHYNVDRAYVADGLNRIMSVGSTAISYDARGNLTNDGTYSYSYTPDNLMTGGPNGSLFRYDALGRLGGTKANISATLIRPTYDGANRISEHQGVASVQRRYVHGPGVDEPIVWYEGSAINNTTRRFLMADERGSIVSVTDSAGATIAVNSYDEYGIPASGNVGKFGYTGQMWLPEAGMWYYKARMYSPTLGRFMQTDPIGYGDGMNWYNYAATDPVNRTDPSGRFGADRGCQWPTCTPVDPTWGEIVVSGTRSVANLPTPLGPLAIQGGMPLALAGGTESVSEAAEAERSKCPSGSYFVGTNADGTPQCLTPSKESNDEEKSRQSWCKYGKTQEQIGNAEAFVGTAGGLFGIFGKIVAVPVSATGFKDQQIGKLIQWWNDCN